MKWLRNGDMRIVHRISIWKNVGRNWGLDSKIIQYSFSIFEFSYCGIYIHTFWLLYTSSFQPLHVSYCILRFFWKCAFMFLWKHILLSGILLIFLSQTLLCASHTSTCVCVCLFAVSSVSLIVPYWLCIILIHLWYWPLNLYWVEWCNRGFRKPHPLFPVLWEFSGICTCS
jgi:hypothetical protein